MAITETRTCPECGEPLTVPKRRVGPMVVCPACRKSVSLKAAASAPAGGRAGARRETPDVREAPPRPAALVWVVQSADGRPAAAMAKADLDRRVAAGEFDARTLVKRQDWSEAKPLAEAYQGLAVACSARPLSASAKGDLPSALSHPASPWAAAPETQTTEPPRPERPPDKLRAGKIFLLAGALACGFWAFYGALGNFTLQPALPRRALFLLFAVYWLAAWLLAAALFNWRLESPVGEPRGLHRMFGEVRTRWLLAVAGVAIMAAIVWVVA
ncbi:MAG TPA: zinc ribbon domain-containing protein [Pirellulales bacterium]|nr:zinc ribbon domain-containing protein [Pirellulales bacterium]